MTIFQTIILAIIEGLTEFIPVSSTGHLILAQHFLNIPVTEFTKSFDIIIQLAAIFAVIWTFKDKILLSTKLWKNTFIAFLPTGIIGLILYKFIKSYLLGNPMVTVISLFVGGLALLIFDRVSKKPSRDKLITDLSPTKSVIVGVFQSLSIIPGVSRSAASIIGGLIAGLSRKEAVEFSFFLAIPTMLAASGYDLLKNGFSFSTEELIILGIGCFFSYISSAIAIKFFLNFVKKHDFTYFAIYRIIIAVIVFFTLLK